MLSHQPLAPTGAPKSVIVVGAGLAGLTCAHELSEAGHSVRVLEAKPRAGGRVWTLRAPFPDGLLAEVGATFLPDNHPLPLHYARTFGLPLVPLPTVGQRPRYRVAGVNVPDGSVPPDWPVPLAPNERGLEPMTLLMPTILALVARQGGWPSPSGPAGSWEWLDHLSLGELLRREGLSPGACRLVQLTLLGNFGEGIETISALSAVRQLALQVGRKQSFAILGGNDRLAQSFRDRLGDRVQLGCEVIGLVQESDGVVLRVLRPSGERLERAERVVLAVPSRVLACLAVTPNWSEKRTDAIRRQRWTPVTRVLLLVERRFWDSGRAILLAASDHPTVRWIAGVPAGQRDILTAYVMGAPARELAALSPDGRVAWARAEAERVFPEWKEANTPAAQTYCWDEDRFAGGGYPWPAPGDDALPEILAGWEGRVHFAGEHTTHHFAWIQGAMESGLRAAREVDAAS